MTKDGWPESFGDTFMTVLEVASMIFVVIFALLIIFLALAVLIAVPKLILRLVRALHKRWYDKNQLKQGSDEETLRGIIASGGNQQDVNTALWRRIMQWRRWMNVRKKWMNSVGRAVGG